MTVSQIVIVTIIVVLCLAAFVFSIISVVSSIKSDKENVEDKQKTSQEDAISNQDNSKVEKIAESKIERQAETEGQQSANTATEQTKENLVEKKDENQQEKQKMGLSDKQKCRIVGWTSFLVGVLNLAMFIIFVKKAVWLAFISVPLAIAIGIVFFKTINHDDFCPECGMKGSRIVDEEYLGEITEIQRQRVSNNYAKGITNAHVSYDKDGEAYKEELVTKTEVLVTFMCPHCSHTWKETRYRH